MTTVVIIEIGCMFSLGAICFEDRFCTSRKDGTREGGWVLRWVGVGGGWVSPRDSAWWLWQLAVEKPWSMPGRPLFCFVAQTGLENTPFTS